MLLVPIRISLIMLLLFLFSIIQAAGSRLDRIHDCAFPASCRRFSFWFISRRCTDYPSLHNIDRFSSVVAALLFWNGSGHVPSLLRRLFIFHRYRQDALKSNRLSMPASKREGFPCHYLQRGLRKRVYVTKRRHTIHPYLRGGKTPMNTERSLKRRRK